MARRLVVLLAAVALTGCGGTASSSSNFSGAERDVADQVEALQSAGESRDGDKACNDVLSAALRRAMTTSTATCADQVAEAMKDADDFELDVRAVQVNGDRASARVQARVDGADRLRSLELVRERGSWRIDSLG